jgi:ABC-2 type transport system ATP-binding protein/lipopolysaccharide transport system ATP-binding protein
MSDTAIEFANVSKRYRLGSDTYFRYRSLRESLASFARRSSPSDEREVWALRDVSLSVRRGEILGVIGRNGAGKTTLLKVLSRITQPTSGVSRSRGQVAALLELGAGFHPELSGRDNIFLSGAIYGMSRGAVEARFDEIVSFAGVERFVDTPVKRYSSGMYLRLAFAVAAHLEAEILAIDEILAVGDASFQAKCLGRMSALGEEGRTAVFVSHDLGSVTRLCTRAIWIDDGLVRADGHPSEVVERYRASHATGTASREFALDASRQVQVLEAEVRNASGPPEAQLRRDLPVVLSVRFALRRRIPSLDVALILYGRDGAKLIDEAWADQGRADDRGMPGVYSTSLVVPPILVPGDYTLGVWIGSAYEKALEEEVLTFELLPRLDDPQEWLDRPRLLQPSVEWQTSFEDA